MQREARCALSAPKTREQTHRCNALAFLVRPTSTPSLERLSAPSDWVPVDLSELTAQLALSSITSASTQSVAEMKTGLLGALLFRLVCSVDSGSSTTGLNLISATSRRGHTCLNPLRMFLAVCHVVSKCNTQPLAILAWCATRRRPGALLVRRCFLVLFRLTCGGSLQRGWGLVVHSLRARPRGCADFVPSVFL